MLGNWSTSRTDRQGTTYTIIPPYLSSYHARLRHDAGHLLARTRHVFRDGTELTLQAYVDYVDAHSRTMDEESFLADIEAALHRTISNRHDVVAGLGARHTRDKILGTENYDFLEPRTNRALFTSFIQDEITLLPRRLSLTVGSKFEHNDFTGWEVQPGARFAWRQEQRWTWWGAVARAVRTPARAERGTIITPQTIPPTPVNPLPTVVRISASDFDREELLAWESGLRFQLHPTLSLDFAVYRNDYDGLRSIEPQGTSVVFTPAPHVVYSSASGNGLRGHTHGTEVLFTWRPVNVWHLQASWATINYDLALASGSRDTTSLAGIPGSTPRHEFKLFSRLDLSKTWSLDAFAWHHTEMRAIDVPAYTGVNLRLGWRPRPNWEIQLIGQDLLDARHPEFPPTYLGGPTQEVPRSVRVEVLLETLTAAPRPPSLTPAPRLRPRFVQSVRRPLLSLLALLALGVAMPSVASAQPELSEYQLKAAFVLNFAKFVTWPTPPPPTVDIAIWAPENIYVTMATALSEKAIADRRLQLRRFSADGPLPHVLFVHAANEPIPAELRARLAGANVLVIGESPGFAARTGIIGFVQRGENLRFQVNIDAAERSGLRLSGRLAQLAEIAKDAS